jgi:cytochrome c5
MAEHDEHSSFIKTPRQLITVVFLAFVVPIVGIVLTVQLVLNRPHADPAALTAEAITARIQPVGKVEFGAPGAAAGGAPRAGEEIVKTVCGACHLSGVAGAPKIGDKAAWARNIKEGLNRMLAKAIKGITVKGAMVMPPRGGAADLSDFELARAIVYMANQSGGNLKEPAAPAPAKPAAASK